MKTSTSAAATQQMPPAGTVHLWHVRPSRIDASFRASLSPAELQHAGTFASESERETFLNIRSFLREVLSSYLDCPAQTLEFAEDGPEQLRLVAPDTLLRFNMSHCADLLLVAVTFGRQVGVDVEYMRADLPFETLADHYFDPKDAWRLRLLAPDEKMRHFYESWTSSEAQRHAVTAESSTAARKQCWSTLNFTPADGFSAALAVEGERFQLNCLSW